MKDWFIEFEKGSAGSNSSDRDGDGGSIKFPVFAVFQLSRRVERSRFVHCFVCSLLFSFVVRVQPLSLSLSFESSWQCLSLLRDHRISLYKKGPWDILTANFACWASRERARARVNWAQGLARTRHDTTAATSAHDRCCTHTHTQTEHNARIHAYTHELAFALALVLSLSAVALSECRSRATLVRSPLSRASCHVLFCVCVYSLRFQPIIIIIFIYISLFVVAAAAASTLNISCLYVVVSPLWTRKLYTYLDVSVCVCVCGGQFMLWSRTPPFPLLLCHCNCCAQQTQTLAVPVMRRLLPLPVACASSAASCSSPLPPLPTITLSSFYFSFLCST